MFFFLELKNMLLSVGLVGKKLVIIMIIYFCRDFIIEIGKLVKFVDGVVVIKVMDI